MAYIGRQQDGFGVRSRFIYTATGGQTTFNTDDSGNALSYADGAYVDVYLNGVLLDPADYTATSLTSIVLGSGATASDILEVIVYDVFSVFSGTFTNGITANTATVTGDLTVDTNTLYVDSTNNRVGIGTTSPQAGTGLHIKTGASGATPNGDLIIEDDANVKMLLSCPAANTAQIHFGDDAANNTGKIQYDHSNDSMAFATSATERMRVDSSGNVGIGTASPNTYTGFTVLTLNHATNGAEIDFEKNGTVQGSIFTPASADDLTITAAHASGDLVFQAGGFTERMRVDSSGRLLVAKTTNAIATVGHTLQADGFFSATRDGSHCAGFNRLSDDGNITEFRKDGTLAGAIGSTNTIGVRNIFIAGTGNGLSFGNVTTYPVDENGAKADNSRDLGFSSGRFDDIFATNATINTSDQNEKQDIASLTSAEITAAKAISKLFKTFKWKDKVTSKGDNARTHTGVIAQEVQSAMSDAGLDATKYAFWCSDTWWEKDVEVPAVEAVEAQDAVYETQTDEEGNETQVLVSEAVEAVEARGAYTRTDTYDTADEAPEGATERTRLGIRYPELLAFIGAATEQRLTHLETLEARIEALENG